MSTNESIQLVDQDELLRMAVDIVAAYVSQNKVATGDVSEIIHAVYNSLGQLNAPGGGDLYSVDLKPAVPIKKSITPDHIICLEDGKKLKMLKRHLRTTYGMTPEDYRTKWGLPGDYPMVAPNYAKQRSEFAKKIGLGKDATGRKAKRK